MFGTLTLLHLAGAVALLLWGTHMVTSGVARGFGAPLRTLIGRGLDNRAAACLVGAAVTALLQSSTATALIATSLAASGTLELPAGIALMLGANVGTALVVQVLSFDVAAAAPVLILLGYLAFRARSGRTKPRNLGRMLIGLGLMLTALSLLGRTLADVEGAPILREVAQALGSDPILSVAAAAGLAWAAHSSVAVVLFVVSLAGSGTLALDGTLALVLGANLGAALAPYLESGTAPTTRRLPLANLIVRAAGCAVALPLLPSIGRGLVAIGAGDPARAALSLHLGLNVALAVAVLPWTSSLATLVGRLLPDPVREDEKRDGTAREGLPRHLDPASLPTPGIALANATLEALHMADLAGEILRDALPALRAGDGALASAIGRRDAAVDRLGLAIRRYLAELGGEEVGTISDDEQGRAQEVLGFVLNVEHIGNIVANNLVEFAGRNLKHPGEMFCAAEIAAIERMHAETLASLRLALAAFLRDDMGAADEVTRRKALLRRLERDGVEDHLRRLRRGVGEADAGTVEASALFLRTLRDLRRVHSHVAALCGPLLERRDAAPPGEGEDAAGAGVPGPDGGDAIPGGMDRRPLPTV